MATSTTWNDTDSCPFCGDALASPGAGFIAHIEESNDCEAAFYTWRENLNDDLVAGWSG